MLSDDGFSSPDISMSGPGISPAVRGTSMWLFVNPDGFGHDLGNRESNPRADAA